MLNIFKSKPRHAKAPKEMEKRVNQVVSVLLNDAEFTFTPFEVALIFNRTKARLDDHFEEQEKQHLSLADNAKKEADEFAHAKQIIL